MKHLTQSDDVSGSVFVRFHRRFVSWSIPPAVTVAVLVFELAVVVLSVMQGQLVIAAGWLALAVVSEHNMYRDSATTADPISEQIAALLSVLFLFGVAVIFAGPFLLRID